ncbi:MULTISPECIES: hypothetical protein [Pectobacterium]|uniref:hypothetical protein n=1 Tax=Pectobacterium TaxID=122277 RepID=UPI00068CF002|nr:MULTISPECIES: hypothetical protein [Pectobacterium]RJL44569.1 hypothetical protein D5078_13745 [Pectobacterium carotovorum]TAI86890.1 hypothetical protein EG330_05790 [Pectobacterium versatile]UUE68955.1 hypothetical protein L0Y21_14420 [Pectobacterium aroidearum]UUE73325.1 hypothetical protein L0Y20_14530 [Pectobacterium aroidearum]UUE77665.1 hypothetical protein L0Y24_13970 [Pectobacterium aroidearum]
MTDITKDDLLYDDYNWKAKQQGDDPKKKKSDGERFSRYEGYEMLYLLNEGFSNSDKMSIETKQRIEWSIRQFLPSGTQSRTDVVSWVVDNNDAHKKAYEEFKKG